MKKRTQTNNLTSQGKNKKTMDRKLSSKVGTESTKRKKGKVKKI